MSRLFGWLGYRLTVQNLSGHALTLWYVASTLLILLVPVHLWYGDPLFAVDAHVQTQAWVWALAFIIFAVSIRGWGAGTSGIALGAVLLHATVTFGGGVAALLVIAGPTSRGVALVSAACGLVLAILPLVLGRRLVPAAALLTVGVVAGMTIRSTPAEGPTPPLSTALHAVSVSEYRNLVDSADRATGGALTALDDGFLLVTARGSFYRLTWDARGELTSRPLALKSPLNTEARIADLPVNRADIGGTFPLRANDVAVSGSGDAVRVYLAHQYWDEEDKCLTSRVSVSDLPPDTATLENPDAWKVVFESQPCVYPAFDLRRGAKGSRLAWSSPSTLLLSIGDHALGMAGAQDTTNPYGKVLQLDTVGHFELLTIGHRNPQGLSVGPDGSVWSTEHGPQGGDEVNYLTAGGNYGWPLATYGVQYGQESWPLAEGRDHGQYEEPALAFVPAIGVSNLIHVGQEEFPNWSSDLLVASLRERSLLRLRVRNDRVVYSERIQTRYRIRDLEQARDGRIVLWTDGGVVLVLSNAGTPTGGELAYAACGPCHGPMLEGTPLGPPLRGIVDRRIATESGFDYSDALTSLGGRWTPARLDQYLSDPAHFAPGTEMVFPGIPDPETVFQLIEYLRNFE